MKSKLSKQVLILALFFLLFDNCKSQCNQFVNFLGNDTTLCEGNPVLLSVPPGYDFYTWSTGQTASSINVNQSEDIILTLNDLSGELVVNGDFEQGDNLFTTDYANGTGGSFGLLSSEAQYAISTLPSLVHDNFFPCNDHTTGSGNSMIVNGSGTPNTNVWCQIVAVEQNTIYQFSSWVMNVLSVPEISNLQFLINGSQIGSVFSTSPTGCLWQQFYNEWNSGMNVSAEICIVNQNIGVSGNDFGLDDISFKEVCKHIDTVSITVNPSPTLAVVSDDTICSNSPSLLIASGADSYIWSPTAPITQNNGDSIFVNLNQNQNFQIIGEINGCFDTSDVIVNVIQTPIASLDVLTNNMQINEIVEFQNTSQNANVFDWDFGNTFTANQVGNQNQQTTYNQYDSYLVSLTAYQSFCSDTYSFVVNLYADVSIKSPNVFTPNPGDSINSYFTLSPMNFKDFKITIFNRWGNVMHEGDLKNEKWFGITGDDKEATEGVYFYKYVGTSFKNEETSGHGFFHLIKTEK